MKPQCDYCGNILPCDADSQVLRRYWQTSLGLLICNDCLLTHCDDYPDLQDDERVAALRLRYARQWPSGEMVSHQLKPGHVVQASRDDGMSVKTIRDTISAAKGVIDSVLVRQAERELEEFFTLHRSGEFLAALQSGKAAWNTAHIIHTMLYLKDDAQSGRRATRQRTRAGFSSGKERVAARKPEWDKWQTAADALFQTNPKLSKIEAARRIASASGGSFEAIRKRIKK